MQASQPAIVNKLILTAAITDETSVRLLDSRYGGHGSGGGQGKIVYHLKWLRCIGRTRARARREAEAHSGRQADNTITAIAPIDRGTTR